MPRAWTTPQWIVPAGSPGWPGCSVSFTATARWRAFSRPRICQESPKQTRSAYFKALAERFAIADFLESWLNAEVLPLLGTEDLLENSALDDAISTGEAARRLTSAGTVSTEQDVLALVAAGVLRSAKINHTGALARQVVFVSAADVDEMLNEELAASADVYNASEVADLLSTDHRGVYRLAAQGLIVEVTTNPRARLPRHGNRGGALRGGGRLFDKAQVDTLAERWAEDLDKRRRWYTVGEAASVLGCSTSTVRRMGDFGVLEIWRDPGSCSDRRVAPESVERVLGQRGLTIAEAATALGEAPMAVRALVKRGTLTAAGRRVTRDRSGVVARRRRARQGIGGP